MQERFNVSGSGGRDCPICFRAGTLSGPRDGDSPRLTCRGCLTVFRLEWSSDLMPDQLVRLTPPAPAAPPPEPRARRSLLSVVFLICLVNVIWQVIS